MLTVNTGLVPYIWKVKEGVYSYKCVHVLKWFDLAVSPIKCLKSNLWQLKEETLAKICIQIKPGDFIQLMNVFSSNYKNSTRQEMYLKEHEHLRK